MIKEPKTNETFINCGGDSLKALMFTESVEESLSLLYPRLKFNKLLDILLTKPYSELLDYLKSEIQDQATPRNKSFIQESKRFKPDKLINESNEIDSIECWVSKLQASSSKSKKNLSKSIDLKVKINWKFDTNKCVDATPLFIAYESNSLILIGSHSAEFFCIDGTGKLVWSFKTKDRIESSAIISRCGQFVIFGCYDHMIYVLRVKDGCFEFSIKTGDIVKSSPCLNELNGHIYVGSYDHHLYCISIEVSSL